MPWWGWVTVGALLLGAEMFLIDAQFYLVFLGVAAAVVGLLGLFGVGLPEWAQWLLFAALSIVSMLTFRKRLYALIRRQGGQMDQRLTVGDRLTVAERIEPGATTRVDYRGTSWTARNEGETVIEAGSEAQIVEVDRLTLHLRRPD
jgi:membrane protein implicated in regulation of membrane protease activity